MKVYKWFIITLWLAFGVCLILLITGSPLIKNPNMIFANLLANLFNTMLYLGERYKHDR